MSVDAREIGTLGRLGDAVQIGMLGRVSDGVGTGAHPIIGGSVVCVQDSRIIGGHVVRVRQRFDH